MREHYYGTFERPKKPQHLRENVKVESRNDAAGPRKGPVVRSTRRYVPLTCSGLINHEATPEETFSLSPSFPLYLSTGEFFQPRFRSRGRNEESDSDKFQAATRERASTFTFIRGCLEPQLSTICSSTIRSCTGATNATRVCSVVYVLLVSPLSMLLYVSDVFAPS